MLSITQNFFYFSYGKLSPLSSIGTDGTFWKDKNGGNVCVLPFYLHDIFKKRFCIQLCSVLIFLFYSAILLIFEKATLNHLLCKYCCPSSHLIFFLKCCPSEIIDFFFKLSQKHRLKCRNCLMFVAINIRVLYVHWNECVRKKGNRQMCSNCNSTWFMQVFVNLHF